jgi:hypothetical protein
MFATAFQAETRSRLEMDEVGNCPGSRFACSHGSLISSIPMAHSQQIPPVIR